LNRLPAAIFVVDVKNEHIAVSEARKLDIPIFAMVDTNSDPTEIDFPIPSNDDASKSIALIVKIMADAVSAGIEKRKRDKEQESDKEAIEKQKENDNVAECQEKNEEAKKG